MSQEDIYSETTQPIDTSRKPAGSSASKAPLNADRIGVSRAEPWVDAVRWGAVWAGLLSAFGLFLLLFTLALALGFGSTSVLAAIVLLCTFFGGFVSARSSGTYSRFIGFIQGFLAWILGVLVSVPLTYIAIAIYRGDVINNGLSLEPFLERLRNDTTYFGTFTFLGLLITALLSSLGGIVGTLSGEGSDVS